MMKDSIYDFPKQFLFEPVLNNGERLKKFSKFVAAGMGGSHLAADILESWRESLNITVHKDYGLPRRIDKDNTLFIASSYSGNTEETIDVFEKALQQGIASSVIATGGKLLKRAKEADIPYVQIPDTGIQPRQALGFSLRAFLKITGDEDGLNESKKLAEFLDMKEYEQKGRELARRIKNKIPVIYGSSVWQAILYNWKIKLNETGKIPAFSNVFPELNHNEMAGFGCDGDTIGLSEKFYFILLKSKDDHPRILKRMEVLAKLFSGKSLPIEALELVGENYLQKFFSSIALADWVAYYTALQYRAEPEQVPFIEEFKKMIAE